MIQKRINEDAVSPVVGVMLMLVVTIIIAAIVASFASGLGGGVSGTPTAVFTVSDVTTSSNNLNDVVFTHKGGDTLALGKIAVQLQSFGQTVEFTNANGKVTGNNAISIGDTLTVDASTTYFDQGSQISYKIIDLTSGNAIASGTFVVS